MRQEWQSIAENFSDEQLVEMSNTLSTAEFITRNGDLNKLYHQLIGSTTDVNILGIELTVWPFLAQALAQRLKAYKENNYNPQLP